MSKLGRLWDLLLPGLICLEPMGAVAYYNAEAQSGASRHESFAAAGPQEFALLIHHLARGAPTPVIPLAGGGPRLGA